ncbi:chorismate mutase [Chitiniphilus shinanonensis]|uniref:chorismate mutase n=1 Tax=Chitiniphilus shinanonensis TaxID=553088 RepID=UPI003040D61E
MTDLAELRTAIDEIDGQLLTLLAERFRVTAEVGRLKKAAALPGRDAQREAEQIRRLHDEARRLGLGEEWVTSLWRLILDEVVRRHAQA